MTYTLAVPQNTFSEVEIGKENNNTSCYRNHAYSIICGER
jgi:hypothetical protein